MRRKPAHIGSSTVSIDVDDAVRLQHVGDGDHRDVTLGVGDRELAGAGLLDR